MPEMPIKYSPIGFSSRTLQRFQQKKPPRKQDLDTDNAGWRSGMRRMLAVVATVAILLASGALVGRSFTAPREGVGSVLVKEKIEDATSGTQYVLGIDLVPAEGQPISVVFVCTEEVWNAFEPGQRVTVQYDVPTADGDAIHVLSIAPLPDPVSL